ncbi:MAG: hypothetical protein HY320_01910 [Armatimonadetes bacterium]|nr:hypothetical protein [Armatimonadota bacterium]
MQIILLLAILALCVLLLLRSVRPKTERLSQPLLPPEELVLALPVSPTQAFARCEAALAEAGAEVRYADAERGLLTAACTLGGPRDRLALILHVYPTADGSEVELDFKTASYSRGHDARAAAQVLALRERILRTDDEER